MDSERWWIVDEIARWWRAASQEERGLLMQRAIEGTKEASVSEVRSGAIIAELHEQQEAREAREICEAWSLGKGLPRR